MLITVYDRERGVRRSDGGDSMLDAAFSLRELASGSLVSIR